MARVKIKGDFDKLNRMVRQISANAGKELAKSSAKIIADMSLQFAEKFSAEGRGPTGRMWKPLRAKRGGLPNKWVSSSFQMQLRGTKFSIQTKAPWGKPHQGGARKRPIKVSSSSSGGSSSISLPKLPIPKLKLPQIPTVSIPSISISVPTFTNSAGDTFKSGGKWRLPKRPMLPWKRFPRKWTGPIIKAVKKHIRESKMMKGFKWK